MCMEQVWGERKVIQNGKYKDDEPKPSLTKFPDLTTDECINSSQKYTRYRCLSLPRHMPKATHVVSSYLADILVLRNCLTSFMPYIEFLPDPSTSKWISVDRLMLGICSSRGHKRDYDHRKRIFDRSIGPGTIDCVPFGSNGVMLFFLLKARKLLVRLRSFFELKLIHHEPHRYLWVRPS